MILNETVAAIADAIREKTGKSELIKPIDFAEEIKGISAGGGDAPSGGSETMYFAAKDGGAMGVVAEMALMGGFAVKKADNTISSIGTFLTAGDWTEALMNVKAIAFALGNYSSGGGADISDPDMLRRLMFQLNGAEEMPKIIEITKEQFYDLNA